MAIPPPSAHSVVSQQDKYRLALSQRYAPGTVPEFFIPADLEQLDYLTTASLNELLEASRQQELPFTLSLIMRTDRMRREIPTIGAAASLADSTQEFSDNIAAWKDPLSNEIITKIFFFNLDEQTKTFNLFQVLEINDTKEKKYFLKNYFRATKLIPYFGEPREKLTDNQKQEIKQANEVRCVAQYLLGCCYQNGKGVDTDLTKAFEWFIRSANGGFFAAPYQVALCYEKGKGTAQDLDQAIEWYRESLPRTYKEKKTVPALPGLIDCLIRRIRNGSNKVHDIEELTRLFEEHANQNMDVKNTWAFCLEMGVVLDKNEEKACQLYRESAQAGSLLARFNLGRCHEFGKGTPVSKEKARNCYTMADGDCPGDCQYTLAQDYVLDDLVTRDLEQAKFWYKRAADKGHLLAQRCLTNLMKPVQEESKQVG